MNEFEQQQPTEHDREAEPVEPAPRTEPMWVTPIPEEPAPEPDDAAAREQWFWSSKHDTPTEHRRHGWRSALAWVIAAMLGAGAGGGAVYLRLDPQRAGTVRIAPAPISQGSNLPTNAAARVAQAVLPSIVQIRVTGLAGAGLGSGVVYSTDGYIITNNHVIEGADQIIVNLPDGDQLPASVIGTAVNVGVDIAVLKIAATTDLVPATLGATSALHVGDLAVAVGSPFGLSATVTAGIISALHRNDQGFGEGRITDAIQTDAPINPGNSGGALANERGEVIGINTAILGNSGGNVGVGFAIPIEIARKVTEQIIKTGHAQLAFMGIQGDNLPGGKGARIGEVTPGFPAQKAGIRPNDVIVSMDGTTITSMDQLITLLVAHDVGDVVKIGLLRGSERLTVDVTLAARPESQG
jgi:putative serine protease PepD